MMNQLRYVVPILMVLAFTGCGMKGGEKPAEGAKTGQSGAVAPDAGRSAKDAGTTSKDGGKTVGSIPSERIIYFDFDRSEVRVDARNTLEKNAAYLVANPNTAVRLEGHADERGSEEYNMALGDRRAQATKRALNVLGVAEKQITTLSYGESRPVDPGHGESAWARNRRVEVTY